MGIRLEICQFVGSEGIGGCDIAQASGRRSRLDCDILIKEGICSECVTSGNVANPIQVANARREGKREEEANIRCNEEQWNPACCSIVVVNENRFALNDRQWQDNVKAISDDIAHFIPFCWTSDLSKDGENSGKNHNHRG